MKVEVSFEDNDNIYKIDFVKFAKELGLTEEQIKKVVLKGIING